MSTSGKSRVSLSVLAPVYPMMIRKLYSQSDLVLLVSSRSCLSQDFVGILLYVEARERKGGCMALNCKYCVTPSPFGFTKKKIFPWAKRLQAVAFSWKCRAKNCRCIKGQKHRINLVMNFSPSMKSCWKEHYTGCPSNKNQNQIMVWCNVCLDRRIMKNNLPQIHWTACKSLRKSSQENKVTVYLA